MTGWPVGASPANGLSQSTWFQRAGHCDTLPPAMESSPSATNRLRVIEVAIPVDLLLEVDRHIVGARSRGEPWGRSELIAAALTAYLMGRGKRSHR